MIDSGSSLEEFATRNGARSGPRMPGRRDVTITMPGDYGDAGMRLKVWKSYPHKLANAISSGDEVQAAGALAQIVLEHNGWLDEMGQPLPALEPAPLGAAPDGPEVERAERAFAAFWDCLPQELALAISVAIGVEISKLMASVRDRRRS